MSGRIFHMITVGSPGTAAFPVFIPGDTACRPCFMTAARSFGTAAFLVFVPDQSTLRVGPLFSL